MSGGSAYIQDYQYDQTILRKLCPSTELITSLVEMYVDQKKSHSYYILNSIFRLLGRFLKPKAYFTRLLSSCIIITQEDIHTFESLNFYYKRLRHLIAISEHWLCGEEQ